MSQVTEPRRGNGDGRHETTTARTEHERPEEIERDLELTRREMSATLEELGRRLSPGELVDQAMRYINAGPGEFAQNLGRAVKYNPIPTTLLGIGLVWLMASNRREPYAEEYGTSNAGEPSIGDIGVEAGMRLTGRMDEPGTRGRTGGVRERLRERINSARERFGSAREHASERASDLREGASERVDEARERLEEGREYLQDRAARARESASRWAGDIRRGGYRAREQWDRTWEEQPLIMGALGIAAGALLGALMPATRQEDELLGEARDRTLEKGAETVEEAAQRARPVAEAAAGAAGEEMQRQSGSFQAGSSNAGTVVGTGEPAVVTMEPGDTRH